MVCLPVMKQFLFLSILVFNDCHGFEFLPNEFDFAYPSIRDDFPSPFRFIDQVFPDDFALFRFHVIIGRLEGEDVSSFCSGTILKKQFIITSASCAVNESLQIYHLEFQPKPRWIMTHGSEEISVIRHPNYISDTNENDIAIIKLGKKVKSKYKFSIKLPREGIETHHNLFFVISGYEEELTTMFQARMNVLTEEDCEEEYNKNGLIRYVHEIMMCARGNQEPFTGGLTLNDLGAGLLQHVSGKEYVIHGIATDVWNEPIINDSRPSVFTRVSSYLKWIRSIVPNV